MDEKYKDGYVEKNYMEAFDGSGEEIGEEVLNYFEELFSLEMPLGRMMKMMPGMFKYAKRGKKYRKNLMNFAPEMMPMMKDAIKDAVGLGNKEERGV
ncbi:MULTISPECIES: hypothetical protein [unclassified Candidatus Frackibacter]|jgi:hypothetical protein|uniref:hypothetical protein n=1 Tax=unclassified Candidatus Frackibacter TaxID=2648818 RepID=UPI00079C561C|nr:MULTISPECIES: hypothetical protein [unclassified Candidatus Frackibacter]KXS43731.1 MAG: hypothetical protein AWU54_948 [Candidatus Frackibacter sp. T328-2]SDC20631.1 hypothetical protein SAMN04515661_1049 [Candidatus Frackibacter sp. WG11]SEM51081.1 hypothetical protein SAMN04488698_105156 [Candidatus Frackibacter sp. WG12]SFL52367.1 hypothetical protein SAMN04488699_104153 [Candidatus Frackibacter sp. WG13]